MNRQVILNILIFVICASFCAGNDWTFSARSRLFPKGALKDCVFPFKYNLQTYYNCTIADRGNGDMPWCSLHENYVGKFKYCNDFINSDLNKCIDGPYEINKKTYTGCDFIPKTAVYKQCITSDNVTMRFCLEEHLTPVTKPLWHPNDCEDRYKKISKYHTMCMGPSYHAIPVAISKDDQTAILAKHNSFRNEVLAKFMFKLYWDDDLAQMAQAHANMCAFDHDLASNRIIPKFGWLNGQNIVWTGAGIKTKLDFLLDSMFGSEKPNFSYGNGCTPNDCRHYTQLMLSTLTRVGCALTHCMYPDNIERLLVCNYIHSQYNETVSKPFEQVDSADQNLCPASKRDATYTSLCDCGNPAYDIEAESIDPTTCQRVPNRNRRSLSKRDLEDKLPPPGKPFMIKDSDTDVHNPAKRDLSKIKRSFLMKI